MKTLFEKVKELRKKKKDKSEVKVAKEPDTVVNYMDNADKK